jgi:hypothetical protein
MESSDDASVWEFYCLDFLECVCCHGETILRKVATFASGDFRNLCGSRGARNENHHMQATARSLSVMLAGVHRSPLPDVERYAKTFALPATPSTCARRTAVPTAPAAGAKRPIALLVLLLFRASRLLGGDSTAIQPAPAKCLVATAR